LQNDGGGTCVYSLTILTGSALDVFGAGAWQVGNAAIIKVGEEEEEE